MGLVLFLVFGLAIGLIARAIMPGDQAMGLLMTVGLGIAGSFFGGFLMALVTSHHVTDFHTAGVIGSLVGALLLLTAAGALRQRSRGWGHNKPSR